MNTRKWFAWSLVLMLSVCANSSAQKTDIGAIGRIAPRNGIVQVVCPAGDLIDSLAVRVGDRVERDGVVLTLRTDDNARLNLEAARSAVREAKELGPISVELQRLKIKSAEQDDAYARRRFERFREIGGESISAQQMEEREYQVRAAALSLEAAKKELERVEREREYRLGRAEHDLRAADHAMKRFVVRSPLSGTVLRIFRNPGDRTDGSPVMQIADLSRMMVVAEVFEGDVKKLSPGMKASVTSNALTGSLTGKVLSISPVVERETKIAQVNIILDDPREAARFVNMEANVVIYVK